MTRLVRAAATAAALVVLAAPVASAQEVTLTVHHFLGPDSTTQKKLIEPWAQRIEEQSDGRIKVEIFPSMAMGGAPPELYRQARDGVADVVWTLIGYTPGVFPRSEVYELPTVFGSSAESATLAIAENFDLIAEDYKDLKPLLVHTHAGNMINTVDKKLASPDDLEGMKLRTPSRTGAWLIEAWGAEPVGMPLPDLPQSLAKGVVDGALVPFEIFPPLNLHELIKYAHQGPNGERFGTSVFIFVMNKDRYESLPDDLKKVIDDNSGMALAKQLGDAWDEAEIPGRELLEQAGGEVVHFSPEAMARFDELGQKVVDRWVEEADSNGLDGQALVDAARTTIEKYEAGKAN